MCRNLFVFSRSQELSLFSQACPLETAHQAAKELQPEQLMACAVASRLLGNVLFASRAELLPRLGCLICRSMFGMVWLLVATQGWPGRLISSVCRWAAVEQGESRRCKETSKARPLGLVSTMHDSRSPGFAVPQKGRWCIAYSTFELLVAFAFVVAPSRLAYSFNASATTDCFPTDMLNEAMEAVSALDA
jgi:hypothetical protein